MIISPDKIGVLCISIVVVSVLFDMSVLPENIDTFILKIIIVFVQNQNKIAAIFILVACICHDKI